MLARRLRASALTSITFLVVYSLSSYLASLRPYVGSCYFWWERYYPFVPIFIVPYWSIDAFFVAAPFFIPAQEQLTQHVRRIVAAILVAGFFFITMPLTMAWHRPPVEGVLSPLFESFTTFRDFYNCAPSLHIALRTLLWTVYVNPCRGWPRALLGGWFLLIGMSTILTWQHYLIDVLTGQLLGLSCLHLFPTEPPPRPEVDPGRRINAAPRVARRYATVALALIGLTVAGWPATVLLLWPAVACLILTGAYAGGGPAWLGKAHGTFPNGTTWLLAPYRWLALLTFRHFARPLPYTVELCPGVHLGQRWTPAWTGPPVTSVLDLTAEYPEHSGWLQLNYLNIPVLDLTCPSPQQLRQAVGYIDETRRHGPVLVHCSLGLGRSLIVGAAYLLASGQATSVAQALEQIRSIQPRAALPPEVEPLLEQFRPTPPSGA